MACSTSPGTWPASPKGFLLFLVGLSAYLLCCFSLFACRFVCVFINLCVCCLLCGLFVRVLMCVCSLLVGLFMYLFPFVCLLFAFWLAYAFIYLFVCGFVGLFILCLFALSMLSPCLFVCGILFYACVCWLVGLFICLFVLFFCLYTFPCLLAFCLNISVSKRCGSFL